MNQYVTGNTIKNLREKKKLTQQELALKLNVSDKTISKWETGKGYPDITILEPLAKILDISLSELLTGVTISNNNVSSNMLRSMFYVCPVCGNVIHSIGESSIHCHGVKLEPLEAEVIDDNSIINVEKVEDEYYVRIHHEMSKQHYISFISAISADRVQMVKLYPESNAEARFKINGVKYIYFYCNKDGLYRILIKNV